MRFGVLPVSGPVQSIFYFFYFEKIRVFKAGRVWPLNILAWDDGTGREVLVLLVLKVLRND